MKPKTKNILRSESCCSGERGFWKTGTEAISTPKSTAHAMSVLLFTSGTTGVAKGVMLSQRNICADIESVTQCLDNDCTDSVLSILPIHHTYECTCDFLEILYMGARIAFCDGLRYIAKNVQEYQPTILMLVPLIIENVYSKIMKQASTNPVKRAAFRCMLWTSGGLQHIGFKNAGRKMFRQVHGDARRKAAPDYRRRGGHESENF